MCGMAQSGRPEVFSADEVSLFQQALAERLHDGPLQRLTAVHLKAANLVRLEHLDVADRLERLSELEALAQAALEQLDHIVRDLASQPADLTKLPLRLAALCGEFELASGISCELSIEAGHFGLQAAVEDVLYRALHELLRNVTEHARATVVRITSIERDDGAIAITVADNGIGMAGVERRGFPFDAGVGLWSIEQRLREFRGTLEIDGRKGFHATLIVPRSARG